MKNEIINIFKKYYYKLYNDMKNTEHGYKGINPNKYHLEGDVWKHTEMVMEKISEFNKELNYNDYDYKILLIAGLFHDSGKPYVWVDDDKKEKRYFFGHWNRSFYIVSDIISHNPFGLNTDQVLLVSQLVINHHRRYEAMCSNVRDKRYTKLLSLLSYCDSIGRIHEGNDENEFLGDIIVDESKLKPIINKSIPTVTFLIGPPNVGKSTYIKNTPTKHVISRDDIVMEFGNGVDYNEAWSNVNHDKVDNELRKRYNKFVNDNISFTVDITTMSKKVRNKMTPKNYNTRAVIFATGYDEIIKRNKERDGKFIPVDVIDRFIKSMSFNFEEEFNEVIVVKPH